MGQLGTGSYDPVEVPTAVASGDSGETFAAVSAGGGHSCAITTQDRAYCWGSNEHGELGIGAIERPGRRGVSRPEAVGGGSRFRQISAGNHVTCAVGADGELRCWGRGLFGQLGLGTTTDWAMPRWVASRIRSATASGRTFSCAVKTDGEAYCWGTGELGELGDSSTRFSTIPIRVGARR